MTRSSTTLTGLFSIAVRGDVQLGAVERIGVRLDDTPRGLDQSLLWPLPFCDRATPDGWILSLTDGAVDDTRLEVAPATA
ncbi:hypothetical protein BAY61_18205 [Prauserella marina]|nr:hypothetical protein BAY61_18205 [Prauserella marina]